MCTIISLYICSIFHGVGCFQFKSRTQSFILQHCSQGCSIKCFISVCQHNLPDDVLDTMLQQRKELQNHLEKQIEKGHRSHISCARLPIGYLECPLHGTEENCPPHIRLDQLTPSGVVTCTKSIDPKVVPPESYALLFVTSLNSSEFNVKLNHYCYKVSIIIRLVLLHFYTCTMITGFKFYTL